MTGVTCPVRALSPELSFKTCTNPDPPVLVLYRVGRINSHITLHCIITVFLVHTGRVARSEPPMRLKSFV